MAEKVMLYHSPAVINGDLWVSSIHDNGLYKICSDNNKCEFIRMFPNESFKRTYLHSSSVVYNNKLFFIPFGGKYISSYNFSDGFMECYRLNNYLDGLRSLFYNCVTEGECLYLIPCRYEYIVEFNMRTEKINEYKIFDRGKASLEEVKPFVLKGGCMGAGKIYIGENNRNSIVEFDVENNSMCHHEINDDISGISNLEYVNGELWIFAKNGKILYGDMNDLNILEGVETCEPGYFGKYFDSVVAGNDIYITKSDERAVYKIDTQRKKLDLDIRFADYQEKSDISTSCLFTLYKADKEIRALDSVSGETYRYDYENNKIIEQNLPPVKVDDVDYSKYKGGKVRKNARIHAREGLELSSFLQCLTEGQYDRNKTYEGMAGKGVMINEGLW